MIAPLVTIALMVAVIVFQTTGPHWAATAAAMAAFVITSVRLVEHVLRRQR